MATYQVTTKQVIASSIQVAIMAAAIVIVTDLLFQYLDLPEVHMKNGECVKVVNYKNGDGFQCQDKDVTLRKYHLVHVD